MLASATAAAPLRPRRPAPLRPRPSPAPASRRTRIASSCSPAARCRRAPRRPRRRRRRTPRRPARPPSPPQPPAAPPTRRRRPRQGQPARAQPWPRSRTSRWVGPGQRPGRPHHQARHRGLVRRTAHQPATAAPAGARGRARRHPRPGDPPLEHAQDHRAAPHREHGPGAALLRHGRDRHGRGGGRCASRSSAREETKVSFNDLIVKACAKALHPLPHGERLLGRRDDRRPTPTSHRRGGRHPRRADHAGRAQRRPQVDAGDRRAR